MICLVEKSTNFVDGYSLRYDWDNYEKFAELFELDTLQKIDAFYKKENLDKLSLNDIKKMVWCGLYTEENQLKLEDVGKILSKFMKGKSLPVLTSVILKAQSESGIIHFTSPGEAVGETSETPEKSPKRSKN